ncbi:hypothetical protein AK812_SmicGene11396 [Symbiodinium microadriaticum]|uniref:Uncharacterized protein n=1 Tax=Symbiodinium microadriaticum TaxID=2951 RepID=A0A1Q9EDD2_SYMMI|nr:hypothetical protein AK812_SmicGene11396 [Symbiodinium microadriaticum]
MPQTPAAGAAAVDDPDKEKNKGDLSMQRQRHRLIFATDSNAPGAWLEKTGSRLPCGARVKAGYPKGMAFRNASEVKSLAGTGRAFTRLAGADQVESAGAVFFGRELVASILFGGMDTARAERSSPVLVRVETAPVSLVTETWGIIHFRWFNNESEGFIVTIEAGAVESEADPELDPVRAPLRELQISVSCAKAMKFLALGRGPRWAEGTSLGKVAQDQPSEIRGVATVIYFTVAVILLRRYNVLPPDFNFTVRPRCLIVSPLPEFAEKLKQNFSQAFNLSLEAAEWGSQLSGCH